MSSVLRILLFAFYLFPSPPMSSGLFFRYDFVYYSLLSCFFKFLILALFPYTIIAGYRIGVSLIAMDIHTCSHLLSRRSRLYYEPQYICHFRSSINPSSHIFTRGLRTYPSPAKWYDYIDYDKIKYELLTSMSNFSIASSLELCPASGTTLRVTSGQTLLNT